ncbi:MULTISPECIES: hypothetical protein [unclassified Corallococcus]|uniref:hypothetical protein n=1 Tax=unclassified Corallococcus TaxID=2685029 RepID=UPI001A8D600E|nr:MULTISPECIES: hypothetical protein [unclassified Corallococcus]MBN9687156.1 hypothetical protein [Corallococcus sp. NCSPR001]WAS89017.1 hypothetical protein O0N60_19040 [Corallococcus sp. NCRR]
MSASNTKTAAQAWRTGLRWFSEHGPHEYGFGVPTAHGEVLVTFRAKEGMSEDDARALQSVLQSVPALQARIAELESVVNTPDTEKLEAIRARHAAATEGPWKWFGYVSRPGRSANLNRLYLATVNRGRRFVMNFVRMGMRSAQPRFQPPPGGLMVEASKLVTYEVDYRDDVAGISAPDAVFMESSWQDVKDLLGMVATLQARVTHLEGLIQDECERHRDNLLERDAARAFALDFATTAEAAVANHRGPKTGMRAPYHGDFANLMPSIASDLGKWARAARACLAFRSAPTIAPASERAEWSTAEAPSTTKEDSR